MRVAGMRDNSYLKMKGNGSNKGTEEDSKPPEEETWIRYKRKRRGTREGDSKLKAAESSAWIYVGRLDPETTKKDMQDYLLENGIAGRTSCTMVSNIDTSKA